MPVHACRRGRSLLPVILRGLLCVGMLQLGEVHYTYGHAQDGATPPGVKTLPPFSARPCLSARVTSKSNKTMPGNTKGADPELEVL